MNRQKKIVLAIALLSYFLTALNNSIIITGLTKIAGDLSASQTAMSWVQNAYLLAFGGCILLGGRLGDIFGRRRVLNLALFLLGIAAALAGWSPVSGVLIFARALEGIAAAVLAPTALALLVDYFEGRERVKAIAWYSSVSGLGSCIGLVLGGALASFYSWRWGFYLDLPIAFLMIALAGAALPVGHRLPGAFDYKGTVLSAAGIFSLVYAMNGADRPWPWAAAGAALLALFLCVERRAAVPVMPLALFQSAIRVKAYAARMLFTCAMFGYWFFVSEYIQIVLGWDPLAASFAFLPMTAATFLAAVAVPRMTAAYGERAVLLFGTVQLLAGFLWLTLTGEDSTYMTMVLGPMILLGAGQGFAMSPMTNLGIFQAPEGTAGAASGLVNAAHQIGGSVGLSFMVAVTAGSQTMVVTFREAMVVGAAFIAAMLVISFLFPKSLAGVVEKEERRETRAAHCRAGGI